MLPQSRPEQLLSIQEVESEKFCPERTAAPSLRPAPLRHASPRPALLQPASPCLALPRSAPPFPAPPCALRHPALPVICLIFGFERFELYLNKYFRVYLEGQSLVPFSKAVQPESET